MIHCAIMGSIERFLSVIIEHFAGAFPLWLCPEQVAVLPVAERHLESARKLQSHLQSAGLRASLDESGESVGKQVRNAKKRKVPAILVIGDKEIPENGEWTGKENLAVQWRGAEGNVPMALEAFIALVAEKTARRSLEL